MKSYAQHHRRSARLLALGGVLAMTQLIPSSSAAAAQGAAAFPQRIPAPDGEVILAGPGERWRYDNLHFAPVRRVGNILHLSGVVAIPKSPAQEGGFKDAVRSVFSNIKQLLEASGSDLSRVDVLQTFHVWDSPLSGGTKKRHFDDFAAVKDEFLKEPYPAWSAYGVTGLLPDNGVVEIQVTAHVAPKAAQR